jgi:2-haloacid dehalogenase
MAALQGIGACVFDAYGTIFDYNSAAERCRDALGAKLDPLNALWREKQLQYSWLRSLEGRHADFWQVTADALDFALAALGVADAPLRERLMELYLTLDMFPEVREALTRIRAVGLRTAILSNGSPMMLERAVARAGIGSLLDHVLSVEEAQIFKPHPDVYRLATDRLGLEARAIAFLSSNGWDAHGAAVFGMRALWCNRRGQPRERLPGALEREIRSLAELPPLVAGV